MKLLVALTVLMMFCFAKNNKCFSADSPDPTVQLYSRDSVEFGKENVLICKVSEVHPAETSITLLKNDEELQATQETKHTFNLYFRFVIIYSATIRPQQGERYICNVKCGSKVTSVTWEPKE